jgi:hypothetical protein
VGGVGSEPPGRGDITRNPPFSVDSGCSYADGGEPSSQHAISAKLLIGWSELLTVRNGGGGMAVFVVETYVVRSGKQGELMTLLRKMREYKGKNPERFKEMRSKRVFSQMFGGVAGRYIELNEFDSLAAAEQYMARMEKDEGFMELLQAALQLTVPATYSLNVWKALE